MYLLHFLTMNGRKQSDDDSSVGNDEVKVRHQRNLG
jgi:hypothetical protein